MSLPQLTLGLRLGDLNSASFQRLYLYRELCSLQHNTSFSFNHRTTIDQTERPSLLSRPVAHQSGTTCVAIDQTQGRYLVSGGADTAIRLWDLDAPHHDHDNEDDSKTQFQPISSLSKANPAAHSHAITSISIYPHDPTPSTLLSTSFDTALLVTALTPTSLIPVHRFPLDHAVYTHALSPHASSPTSSLIAAGTAHPSVRLLDLRSGLSTHSLPGHQGSIWTLTWHPRHTQTLLSAGTDGRILFFDIRRAAPAFASLHADDSLGILSDPSRPLLSYTHRAHSGPITGITFIPDSNSSSSSDSSSRDLLLSASHDSRLRVWNTSTLANRLAHFGPRIRNSRTGNLVPLSAPATTACGEGTKRGAELVFWPNDDGRGEIFVSTVREGELVQVMQMQNNPREVNASVRGKPGRIDKRDKTASQFTAAKRINTMAFRPVHSSSASATGGIELYTGHGDGSINLWTASNIAGEEMSDTDTDADTRSDSGANAFVSRIGAGRGSRSRLREDEDDEDQQRKKKRKREADLAGLVQGLSRRS